MKMIRCPNSFAQDCIRVMKKSSINFTKTLISQERLKQNASFFQKIMIVIISSSYIKRFEIKATFQLDFDELKLKFQKEVVFYIL